MFGMTDKKKALLESQVEKLEARVIALMEERQQLLEDNDGLKVENQKLSKKRQMEQEEIAHKLKMREEQVQMDSDKKVAEAERKADERVAKVKDEFRDKLENQLTKRGDELKEMYKEILTRLPDVNLAIKQKG